MKSLRRALLFLVVASTSLTAVAQTKVGVSSQKLPSAEKVIENYLKTIGGKKRVATIRDATYEWQIQLNNQPLGIAKTRTKAPASVMMEMTFGNGKVTTASNGRSAWRQGLDGILHTLTGGEAATVKLRASLEAKRLVEIKKANVLARTISVSDTGSGTAYVVEFSLRSGARLNYWFSTTSKLLLSIEDNRSNTTTFEDYRAEGNILEPHRVRINQGGTGDLVLVLQNASYNTGIADAVFDPPRSVESAEVAALLREVARNQDELEQRFTEYSFRQKETDREITGKGVVKKETEKVFEVYPIAHREPIMKLISENGVPLSGERAVKEQKRVEEEFLKAERDKDKDAQKAKKYREERDRKMAARAEKDQDQDLEVSQFLRVHEFVSPRRERMQDRESVVFDFRVRPGFKPRNRQEDLISKLVGVVWIDPVDKQIMRLEARLAEGFKIGGGLVVSLRPGAAALFEQTRMKEGVWLPRLAQVNLSVKVFLFGGGDINKTIEWSDYQHFSGDVRDYKLDVPKTESEAARKP